MSGGAIVEALDREGLLCPLEGGLVRVPHLVRGRLVAPPPIGADEARAALATVGPGATYARVAPREERAGAQVLRETLVDRATMRARAGDDRVLVLPDVDAASLLYEDPGGERAALAAVPFERACALLEDVAEATAPEAPLGQRLRALVSEASDLADVLLDAALAMNAAMLRAAAVREVVDRELGVAGVPGSRFLDGWVEMDAPGVGGPTAQILAEVERRGGGGAPSASTRPALRALPTLQIHVTAGNAPVVAPASAARALSTRSGGVVKLPSGAVLPGAALGLALAAAARAHPGAAALAGALSLVYWKGGDSRVEERLFDPAVFDRVVVWGAPDAVERIGALAGAAAIRTLTFNPRYGVSLVGREAFMDPWGVGGPAAAARRAAADTVIWNQRACIASLVHYVESDEAGALRYAEALRDALAAADAVAPAAPAPAAAGWIQRLRRGTLAGSRWLPVGGAGRDLRAAVVLVPGPFDLGQHPLSRVVMVRRVDRLEEAVALCHRGVSTAGVYPEARRLALRDALAARGVSNVLPLGGCERAWAGMPHDGMRVLADLVDWVNA
jgi:hypothetical protein